MSLEQTTENNKNPQKIGVNEIKSNKSNELSNLFKPLEGTDNIFVCELNKNFKKSIKNRKKLYNLVKRRYTNRRKLFKKYVKENYSKDEIKIKNHGDCNLMVFSDKYFKDIEKYSTKKNIK